MQLALTFPECMQYDQLICGAFVYRFRTRPSQG